MTETRSESFALSQSIGLPDPADSTYTDHEIIGLMYRARSYDFSHDHAALQDGKYAKAGYNTRFSAEEALTNDYRYCFKDDLAAVARALQITDERAPMTDYGMRGFMEDYDFYRRLFTDATKPERYLEGGKWKEVNERQNTQSQSLIRRAFGSVFETNGEYEMFAHPEDIAEKIPRSESTVWRQMAKMDEYKKVDDPTASGRGSSGRKVFIYEP